MSYYKYCQLTRENYNEKYNDWNDLLKYIFNYMETNETYHIPLHHHYFKAGLDYLSSEGVLIKTENGYIFCHEKVSDYFYTLNFKNNKENLESFLIDNKQTLYLRKFVKILLEFEKEENYDKYINISQELLESNKIRIHLKIFILDILNNTSEIKKEFTILKDFIKNSDNDLYYAVWDRIYKNPETWFKYFNKNNLIEKYKNKELNNEITPLLIYNKSNPETAKLFLDNLNKSEKWNEDAMLFIQFAPISNEKSFNLLIRLIKENIYSSKFNKLEDYYNELFRLRELSSNQFIEVLHEFMNNILENEKFDINNLKLIRSYSDDVFFNNIIDDKDCSLKFIKKILPLMIKISDLKCYKNKDTGLKKDLIWKPIRTINYKIMKTENGIGWNENPNEEIYHPKTFDEKIVNCMTSCITTIYHDNLEFNKIKEILINSNIDSFLEILLEIYTCNDNDKQNIYSIITNEKFFELISYPEFIKTNIKLLENDEKEKLEKQILEYFKNKTNKSEIKYRILENIENPSEMTKNRIQELNKRKQKFNTNTNAIRSFPPILSVKDVEDFTDEDWLNIFNKHNNSMLLYPFIDIIPQDFFVVLMELSKKDPLRFIELIEHINGETHKDYYNAILYGVSKSEIDFNNSLRLCRRCHSLQYKPCGKGIIDVLSNFPEKLDKECIDIINYYLIEDPDPSRETEKQNYLNNDIESDGLNSVRGHVADRLGNIFYHNQELVNLFEPSLKKLIKDPCISVRAMAVCTLFYIHDNDLKLELFKELININEDKILETKWVKKFLLDNIHDNFHELEYLIVKMIDSENPKINEYIGEIITLYSLMKDECDSYLRICLNRNKHTKIGILNAILHYVKEINNDMIEKIIEKLIKEDDKKINELISSSMAKISENTINRNEELLTNFVKSKNNYNYYYMLHNFNKIINYNTTIILDLLEIIVIKLQDESLRELTRGRGIISECSDLILKIYRINNNKSRNRCLDLIDEILKLPGTGFVNNKIDDII